MAKHIILYNTVSGRIIRVEGNPSPKEVLASGSGTVSDEKMTGVSLGGNAREDVEWVRLSGSKVMMIAEWASDTEISFAFSDRFFQGEQDYELMKAGSAVQFSAQEKADRIASTKAEVGHDDIDALLVTTDFPIDSTWRVNTTTHLLEKKTADITYD